MTPRERRKWTRKVALEVALLRTDPARHCSIRRQAARVWRRRDELELIELGQIDLGGEA